MSISPEKPASSLVVAGLGSAFLLAAGFLVYSLATVWPSPVSGLVATTSAQGTTPGAAATTTRTVVLEWEHDVFWFGRHFTISAELRLLLIVILASALGSYIHAATSFASYVGNRTLQQSWLWWYILRAPVGIALAIVFYSVVRGGFFSSGAVGSDMSPFGVAAVSGLVGLFSKQATDKLRETFDTLFRTAPGKGDDARSDKLEPLDMVLKTIDPTSVAAGAANLSIKIKGDNFERGSTVLVNELERETEFVGVNDLLVHLEPTDTASAGVLKILVKAPPPSGRLSNPLIFTVHRTE